MLIRKYIGKQLVRTLLAILLIVLLIALSNKFVIFISKAANGEIATSTLFQLIFLHIPELLATMLPLCFFLSIILTMGKLYAESEMVGMLAGGVQWRHILLTTTYISIPLTVIVGVLTLWSLPQFHRYKEELIGREEPTILMQTLAPGRFHALKNGGLVFYVEGVGDGRKLLQEVFIAEQPTDIHNPNEHWSVLTAKRGKFDKDPDTNNRYLELQQGTRYEGKPGSKNYTIVHFERYGRLIEQTAQEVPMFNRVTPTAVLWNETTPTRQAELQWRISMPFMVPILMILGLGISRVPPRLGRYRNIVPGILIYILYTNFLTVCKRWIESGSLSPMIGLWIVHLCALLIGLLLLARHTGFLDEKIYALKQRMSHR